jgi:hypothetical protein
MNHIRRYLLIIVVITALIASILAYRTEITTTKAAQYAPTAVQRTVIPAGTQIQAILRDGIAESTRPGDSVVGFVSAPVVVNDELVIPIGTVLTGVVQEIAAGAEKATVRLKFLHLVFDDQEFSIQTDPVIARTPIVSDFNLLSSALQTATGAAVGTATGAVSKDEEMIGTGLVQGALRGVAPSKRRTTPITLVLNQALELPT